MFDRFEYGVKDYQEAMPVCVCDWCKCEIYGRDELFLADYFDWVCEDCYDDWQRTVKRKAEYYSVEGRSEKLWR